jgi:hypothetical protein
LVVEAVMEGPFEAKAVFGIVGDRQGPGLSSTARDELGEIRYGREAHRQCSAGFAGRSKI